MKSVPSRPLRRHRLAALITMAILVAATAGCTSATPRPDVSGSIDDRVDVALEMLDRGQRVRAILAFQDGLPVYERYIDSTPDDYWDVRSVTKSVVSTLIGIAIDRGLISGVDATLEQLLPSHAADLNDDTAGIPLSAVLTHTANFLTEGDDDEAVWAADDVVRAILEHRAARGPGDGSFRYSDAGAHILSAVLVEATGMPVVAFARENLFGALSVSTEPQWQQPPATDAEALEALLDSYDDAGFAWPTDPQGIQFGNAGLRLRPSDLARFGELFRSEGIFAGRRVVSETWVAQATAPLVAQGASRTIDYGYQWWVDSTKGYFCAQGRGGTIVLVDPDKDAVIVVASQIGIRENTGMGVLAGENARFLAELILAKLE